MEIPGGRMKSPRAKIHLLDVDEPLLAYHNLIVRCGLQLFQAEPKFMWTEDVSDDFRLPLGTCKACMEIPFTGEEARHYCYGLIEGQEGFDEKRKHAELVAA
jgi:hypothetical protein